jgi:hypothetical protein
MKMKVNIRYLLAFLIILITEVIIGLFVHDAFIRPYFGDVLVVILMYTFIRGITGKTIKFLPLYLFLFAAFIELLQYFHITQILHLQHNKLISVILGASFDIADILCYLTGAVLLFIWERIERLKS